MRIRYFFLFSLLGFYCTNSISQDCTQAITSFPYHENFQNQSSTALPACYTNETLAPSVLVPPNNEWLTFLSGNGEKYAKLNVVPGNSDKHSDVWMYLPKMYFSSGITYKLSFLFKSSNDNNQLAPNLFIAFGTCASYTCMTNNILQFTNRYTQWTSTNRTFSVSSSGNYYIGFNHKDYQNSTGQWSDLDSITIQEFATVPVKMSALNYATTNSITKLFFSTFTEQNNNGFEIEQSSDGTQFQRIDFIASKAANGNSTAPIAYEYMIPPGRLNAGNFYRLKQLDKNGGIAYSN